MKRFGKPWARNTGMTLVETMVAIFLLSLFIISAIQVVTRMRQRAESVRERATATLLAWNRLQRAHHFLLEDLDGLAESAPGIRINADGLPDSDGFFLRNTTISTVTNAPGAPLVRVMVQVWPLNHRTRRFDGHPEIVESLISPLTQPVDAP